MRSAAAAGRRTTLSLTAAAVLVCVVGLAVAQGADRGLLWRVVQTCVVNARITGGSFPCLDVNISRGVEAGFAVVRAPLEATHIVVVPTARVEGVEASQLLEPSAENYFADAWAARHYVTERISRPLAREDIGMALNSLPGRSQDQLHIHVNCLQAGVRDALKRSASDIHANTWSRLPFTFHNDRYWVMRLKSADLKGINVFRLVMDGLRIPEADRPKVTIVLAGAADRGEEGFYLLSLVAARARRDQGHGEFLLDHTCAAAGG